MPEPQKLHIGLIDLFSVWLPGALLAYLLQPDVQPRLKALGYPAPGAGIESWAVFLFISYIAGHFIFVAGAIVFDRIDKRIRKAGWNQWKAVTHQEAEGDSPPNSTLDQQVEDWKDWREKAFWRMFFDDIWKPFEPLLAWLSLLLFDEEDWAALGAVRKLKRKHLSEIDAASAVNAFQWSKARLALGNTEALAVVQRFEADSKFFRSLCAVLAVLAGWGAATGNNVMLAAGLALLPAAFGRFLDLRAKSTSQAYWLILALETTPPPKAGPGAP